MKIRRDDFPNDPCAVSMSFLKERIESFFTEYVKDSTQRYYPEHDIYINQKFDPEKVLDVVLFGNNIKSFFQSGLWPNTQFRIWTLSPSHKKFWDEVLLATLNQKINLIPRSLITKKPSKEAQNLIGNLEKPATLIFAGRLSAQKNITYLLLLYKELEVLNLPVTLRLLGKFDDQYDEIYGRRNHENYKEEVINLIRKLDFDNPPIIDESLGQNDWPNLDIKNPILISLSTYHCEDFGVSVTQAQEKGWPLILTDMLGHKGVSDQQLMLIPSKFHIREHLSMDLKRIFAKELASYIYKNSFSSVDRETKDISCERISASDLSQARADIIHKRGTHLSLINAENVGLFYDTQVGLRLFLDFVETTYPNRELIVYVVEDADHKGIPLEVQNILHDSLQRDDFYPYFISLKNLFKSKVELELLTRASQVVLLLTKDIRESTMTKLVDHLGISKDRVH